MVHGHKKQNKHTKFTATQKKNKKRNLQIYQGQTVPSETRNPIVIVNVNLTLSLSLVDLLS